MPSSLRILVPFSDRKKPGGREGATMATRRLAGLWAFRTLATPRIAALDAFRVAMAQSATALKALGLSGAAFREAYSVNKAFDRCRLATALARCNGTFAECLCADEAEPRARRKLDEALLFMCPLFGVLAPSDLVPDYRCPEGAKLPGLGSLHKHWKPEATKFLNRLLKQRHVLSFLPARLAALWEPDGGAASLTSVRFARRKGEKLIGETAATPGLTGEALRFVAERGISTPHEFAKFKSTHGHVHQPDSDEVEGRIRVMKFVR